MCQCISQLPTMLNLFHCCHASQSEPWRHSAPTKLVTSPNGTALDQSLRIQYAFDVLTFEKWTNMAILVCSWENPWEYGNITEQNGGF